MSIEHRDQRPTHPWRSFLRRHAHLLAAIALGCMAALLVHAALSESPIIDEPNHVTRGMALLSTGDARLSVAHPPLGNLLQGIPGHLLDRPVGFRWMNGWEDGWDVRKVLRAFFAKDYERARTALVGGRVVTALLTVLLGLYLYHFCLRWGRLRALLTVVLFSFFPLFLAHGHLVTTDIPFTLASTIAIGEFVRWTRERSWLRFLTFSGAVGAAFSIKFTAVYLIPALGLSGLLVTIRGFGPLAHRSLLARLGILCRDFALVTLVVVLIVNASYGFQRTGWTVERTLREPEPVNWITAPYKGKMLEEHSFLPSLPSWLPIPLPYPWVFGFHSIRAQNERTHNGWFWGEQGVSRLYFPTLAVVKNPAAILLLLLIGAGLFIRRFRLPSVSHAALWLSPLLLFGVSIYSDIQIGVRHLLPIYPFVVMAAAWAAAALWVWRPLAATLVAAMAIAEGAAAAPGYLGHFSWAIGGSKAGHRLSMLGEDWGQDVRALAAFANKRQLEPLYYQPYGPTASREMRRFGARFQTYSCKTVLRRSAWVAIHANQLVRWKRNCGAIGREMEPVHVINDHILLYWVDVEPPPPPEPPDLHSSDGAQ